MDQALRISSMHTQRKVGSLRPPFYPAPQGADKGLYGSWNSCVPYNRRGRVLAIGPPPQRPRSGTGMGDTVRSTPTWKWLALEQAVCPQPPAPAARRVDQDCGSEARTGPVRQPLLATRGPAPGRRPVGWEQSRCQGRAGQRSSNRQRGWRSREYPITSLLLQARSV